MLFDIYEVACKTNKGLLTMYYQNLDDAKKWLGTTTYESEHGVYITGKDLIGDDVTIKAIHVHATKETS